jgi:hypothetical protein
MDRTSSTQGTNKNGYKIVIVRPEDYRVVAGIKD